MGLEINYRDTIRKAERLQTISHDITKLCNSNVNEVQSATNGSWIGDGGDRFRKNLRKHTVNLSNRAKDLNGVAAGLERTAKRLERIEKAAAAIFNK